jgi:hypothetical protein
MQVLTQVVVISEVTPVADLSVVMNLVFARVNSPPVCWCVTSECPTLRI